MIVCYPQYFESKSRFLSYTVVAKAFSDAGHELTPHVDAADVVLFSICDAVEYRQLMAMSKRAGKKPLIVGGSFCFNFWSVKLWCDGVWVGEVYDMADCRTVDEILESEHCYTGGVELPKASTRIDWDKVPIAQIEARKCYYWGGVGCKNKCKCCYTSWTHAHQVNSKARIEQARKICKAKGIHLMVSSNEYDNSPGLSTFDMMLKDYVRTPVKCNMVRCGIEFATEETRARMGKPVSKDDMFKALQKSKQEKIRLRWFHIAGYNTIREWDDYMIELAEMLDYVRPTLLFHLEFNNLDYNNYTPLYRERKNIDLAKYADSATAKRWRNVLARCCKSVMVGSPSVFQNAACRMGVALATDRTQAEFWANVMINPKKKITAERAREALFDTGVFDTPPLTLRHSTGEIFVNEKWR